MFSDLESGARIGLVAREVVDGGDGGEGPMLVWEIGSGGVTTQSQPFPGYAEAGVDILWVAEDKALAEVTGAGDDLPAAVRQNIRSGDILSFVMRPLDELVELGFEDFFESLGLSYMGACR